MATTLSAPPALRESLRDEVLAILSLAATTRGITRIRITDFYREFASLATEFPQEFPPLVFTRAGHSAYSKRLDKAIQSLIGYSICLPNPHLQDLELTKDAAERHLNWLRAKYGKDAMNNFSKVAGRMLAAPSASQ